MKVQNALVFVLALAIVAIVFLVEWIPNSNPFPSILPVGCAQTVSINNHSIRVELAQTPKEQERGLMDRTSLEKDQGMLFLFALPGTYSFWMKNTLIPLDMVFLDADKHIAHIANAFPCKEVLCPTFTPPNPIQYVLEVPLGTAQEYAWGIGSQATFHLCNENT